ncbi:AbfB domain-containing protein [Actinoplanes sp. LDG1-06]|uniref:AbfB domain-containing protein n=1 Tax=Paractinoplanes ovalisporus TaxID=2810368 RepID=A0ABS2AA01_9ACTN|nr:AbfB domain-containing protein [Actinoplanes ovalisporus]MBM2616664.1 AbfB domain-containing protein [Actinoplanes ovalisporus]
MPDEDRPERLRIGGWVPPYRDTKGPLRPPVPPRRRAAGLTAALWNGPIRRHTSTGLGRRVVAAAATGVVIAVAGLTALALRGDDGDSSLVQRVVLPPYTPSAPVSILPAPTTSSAGPGSITRTPTRHRETEATRTRPTTKPPTSRPPTTAPAATQLVVGATVGLAHADYPGYRLRHHDFVARFDAIDEGSSRGTRQDSRFTVRRGLASSSCVSLESVNFPGYFLRHRDYVLHLDRRDGSDLFDKDGTFCPHAVRDGAALILESVNYPSYYLVGSNRGVRIERVSPGRATAFLVREAV